MAAGAAFQLVFTDPKLHGLYGITDAALMPDEASLLEGVEAALDGGMRILQYRDKSDDARRRESQARALLALCRQYDAILIINDDVELARKVSAHGVHLGREDGAIAAARKRLGDEFIIGVSCYNNIDLARQAQRVGADYVAFGRFFPSQTKPEAIPANPEMITRARREIGIPLCAIGGVTAENAATLIERGADMVAVIHDLFAAADIRGRAQDFRQLFTRF
jgi:thiamine-phosphate pyrophosphorylase